MATPLSDAQARRLIDFYGEAEKELLRECNRLLLSATPKYSAARVNTLLQRVRQIRSDLLAGSRSWCEEAIPASYESGMIWADKDPISGARLIADFSGIHQQAVQVLAENACSRLEDVDRIVGRRIDDIFRTVSLEAAKGSVIGYESVQQTARRIREDLAARGITGFVDRAGHEWNMSRYAKVLAQETTNQAFRQGTINRFEEHGHDLVRLSSHTGACPRCAPWEGKTLSLTGTDPDYPALDDAISAGVFHVGCLHVLSLAPEELERTIKER